MNQLAPWPYDCYIQPTFDQNGNLLNAGIGLMLAPDPQTKAIISSPKVQPYQQVAPIEFNYSAIPPFDERAYEFRRMIMGMGEKRQQFTTVRRYFYADGVDASINGMPMLGPEMNTITPGLTGEIRDQAEGLSGGVLKKFILAGQYVLVVSATATGDTNAGWSVSHDLGMGAIGQSIVRFRDPTTLKDCLYVATSDDKLWQYDGTNDTGTWTNITANLSATVADQAASFLEVNGNALIRAWGNKVANCASDPTVANNWSGNVVATDTFDAAGDASQPITWLRVYHGVLFIFKTNGIFTVDASGITHELFTELRVTPDPTNGRNAEVWQGSMWFRYGDGFYSLDDANGAPAIHPVGPERFIENDSPVRGYVTATAGWSNWFNFIALYNTELDASYILKYGAWFADDQPPLGSSAFVRTTAIFNPLASNSNFFEPVLHGAIASFPGKRITHMAVTSLSSGQPNQRLYIGFADGTLAWCTLPRGTPNPLADANCRFQDSGVLYWGQHTMLFPGDDKSYRGVTVFGPGINDANTVNVSYNLVEDESAAGNLQAFTVGALSAYTVGMVNGVSGLDQFTVGQIGGVNFVPLGQFLVSGQRIDMPYGTEGTAIQLGLLLTSGNNGLTTPVIEGLALHEALVPDLLLERDMVIRARDTIARRDGSIDWRSGDQIRTTILNAAASKALVPMILPDGKQVSVQLIDYNEMYVNDQQRFGNAWDIPIKAIEFATTLTVGTVSRLAGLTVGGLKQYTVQQLAGL